MKKRKTINLYLLEAASHSFLHELTAGVAFLRIFRSISLVSLLCTRISEISEVGIEAPEERRLGFV